MANKAQTFTLTPSAAASVAAYDPQHSKTYGRSWQRLRARFLAQNPLCLHCLAKGRTTAATQVDHIIRVKRGGTNHESNLQPLCISCHSKKTMTEERIA